MPDPGVLRATVVTDASYSPHSQVGTWAAWIRLEGRAEPLLQSGRFALGVDGSTQAEICAAGFGLAAAMRAGATEVELHVDSMSVLLGHSEPSNPNAGAWAAVLRNLETLGGPLPRIEVRHVRGHTLKADEISLANQWCDETAGRLRRAAEAEIWPEASLEGPRRRPRALAFLGVSRCGLTGLSGWAIDLRVTGEPAPLKHRGTFDAAVPNATQAAIRAGAEAVALALEAGATHVTVHSNLRELLHGINRADGAATAAWRETMEEVLAVRGLGRPEILLGKSLLKPEDGPKWARQALGAAQKEAQAEMRAAREAAVFPDPEPVLEPGAP